MNLPKTGNQKGKALKARILNEAGGTSGRNAQGGLPEEQGFYGFLLVIVF